MSGIFSLEARDMDTKLLSAPESNNTITRFLGQMARLVASITLNCAMSYVMQSAFLTQGTVSSILIVFSWSDSIRPKGFLSSVMLWLVIIVAVVGVSVTIHGMSSLRLLRELRFSNCTELGSHHERAHGDEAGMSREAWGDAVDAERSLLHGGQQAREQCSDLLETDRRRQEEMRELRAADRTRQQQIIQTLTAVQTLQRETIPLQGLVTTLQEQVTALQGQVMTLQGQVTALQGQQGPTGGPALPELPEDAGTQLGMALIAILRERGVRGLNALLPESATYQDFMKANLCTSRARGCGALTWWNPLFSNDCILHDSCLFNDLGESEKKMTNVPGGGGIKLKDVMDKRVSYHGGKDKWGNMRKSEKLSRQSESTKQPNKRQNTGEGIHCSI
ncbi:hypothetical protein Tco_0133772, partial [Tanacetum coccineum]